MLTALLTSHAGFLFWAGVVLEVIGQLWLLFASYACDVSLARWTLLFPPIALILAVRYPEECLRPVIICVLAGVMIGLGSAYSPAPARQAPDPFSRLSALAAAVDLVAAARWAAVQSEGKADRRYH